MKLAEMEIQQFIEMLEKKQSSIQIKQDSKGLLLADIKLYFNEDQKTSKQIVADIFEIYKEVDTQRKELAEMTPFTVKEGR